MIAKKLLGKILSIGCENHDQQLFESCYYLLYRETATGKFMLQQGNGHYIVYTNILMVPTKVIKSD